jgi:hypothetical protein
MSTKRYDEVEVVFSFKAEHLTPEFPYIRTIIVHTYGGDIEQAMKVARKQLRLGPEWIVTGAKV